VDDHEVDTEDEEILVAEVDTKDEETEEVLRVEVDIKDEEVNSKKY